MLPANSKDMDRVRAEIKSCLWEVEDGGINSPDHPLIISRIHLEEWNLDMNFVPRGRDKAVSLNTRSSDP